MGFWSAVEEFASAVVEGLERGHPLSDAHPSLREAWARYEADGYTIHEASPLALTGVKSGFFSDVTLQLRVLDDGAVEVDEGGILGESYVIPRRPGHPTALQHLEAVGTAKGATAMPTSSVRSARVHSESDGVTVEIALETPAGPDDAWALLLGDERSGGWVHGSGGFADEEGDFVVALRAFPGEKSLWCFVPTGAAAVKKGTQLHGRLAPLSEAGGDFIDFSLEAWDGAGTLGPVAVMRPLIELARWMSEAQGVDAEVVLAELAEEWDLRTSEVREMRGVWQRADRSGLDDLGRMVAIRLPDLTSEGFADALADFPSAWGRATPAAIAIAQTTGTSFGMIPSDWERVLASLGAAPSAADRQLALAELELGPEATGDEIRAAYRRLMRDFHPDRASDLPPAFRDFATRRAQEVNAAYALLMPRQE